MNHIRHALPFLAVLVLLVGSVLLARAVRTKPADVCPVNTMPDQHGDVRTVRVFSSVSSVVVIDRANHRRKKQLASAAYAYDAATTRLTFSAPLPFSEPVIHIEGTAAQPEQFCLYDYAGGEEALLVLMDGREAIAGYEYVYDEETRILTFRSDLHPERDGKYYIAYETADGTHHGFGNWTDDDRLYELEWQWLHRTKGAPMQVMKNRSRASARALSKEAGFSVRLPKTAAKDDGTFLIETMDGTEKRVSVMRWYDDNAIIAECRREAFDAPDAIGRETRLALKNRAVTKSRISGTRTLPDGTTEPAALTLYQWQEDGTCYQLTAGTENEAAAEAVLAR